MPYRFVGYLVHNVITNKIDNAMMFSTEEIIRRDFAPEGHSRGIGEGLFPTAGELMITESQPGLWRWGYTPRTLCAQIVEGRAIFADAVEFATMNKDGRWFAKTPIYVLYASRRPAHPLGLVPGSL